METTSATRANRTFSLNLHGQHVTVEAFVNGSAEVLSVVAHGQEVSVSSADLDTIEAAIYDEATEVEAHDSRTGSTATFTVRHFGDHIQGIFTSTGGRLADSGELFTEVSESFHIDRHWAMMEDSDVQGHARHCYA